jgi:PIN domain nuclease of toxin-antitoxin system
MKYLLDTHVLLWAIGEPEKLSINHKNIIEDKSNEIYVSFYSYMEISIKLRLDKLADFDTSLDDFHTKTEETGIINLGTDLNHLIQNLHLPLFAEHRDPFDRLIIATAISEGMKILTVDSKFSLYKDFVGIL